MSTSLPIQSILAALSSGRPGDAEALCRQHLSQHPDNQDVLLAFAMSLHVQGKLADALPVYQRLTQLHVDSGAHWANYATILFDCGDYANATLAYANAIRLDPDSPHAYLGLGLTHIQRQDYPAAREAMLDALDRDRDTPRTRIHAARACSLCQDFHNAEDLIKPWRKWLPLHDDHLQVELAQLLLLLANASAAQWLLEDAISRNPQFIAARILLARVEERLNRPEQAEALITALEGTQLDTTSRTEVMQVRALLTLRQGDATTARALLDQAGPLYDRDSAYYLELANVCDKLRDCDAAMRALKHAHALRTADLRITSPEDFGTHALPLPATILNVDVQQFQAWPQLIAPDANNSPVFIVGFPRSGTTLLEQMLDAHPRLQSMDENPFFDRLAGKLRSHDQRILDDLSVLRQLDCDELRKQYLLLVSDRIARRWDAQLVDKNPLNMLWLPMIYRLFPNARFVLCLRHPCDVLLSCYMQNFRSNILIAACESLPRLAAAYVQAMQCWLQHAAIFQPQVLISRYEELVADPVLQTQCLAQFLQLEDPSPLMSFNQRAREKGYIATPSYRQVIEPINSKGLNRWHRYREYFEPVLPILEPMLNHWGYTTDV